MTHTASDYRSDGSEGSVRGGKITDWGAGQYGFSTHPEHSVTGRTGRQVLNTEKIIITSCGWAVQSSVLVRLVASSKLAYAAAAYLATLYLLL